MIISNLARGDVQAAEKLTHLSRVVKKDFKDNNLEEGDPIPSSDDAAENTCKQINIGMRRSTIPEQIQKMQQAVNSITQSKEETREVVSSESGFLYRWKPATARRTGYFAVPMIARQKLPITQKKV